MFWRISTQNGMIPALQKLFGFLQEHPKSHVVYFNCTTAATILEVARQLPDPERLKSLDYQKVTNVEEIMQFPPEENQWVVIEQLDAIMQEPCPLSYADLNRLLSQLMNTMYNVVFLDDWGYLDQYWLRKPVDP